MTRNTPRLMPADSWLPGSELVHRGKVRELYRTSHPDQLLMVATDTISAFDHVLAPPIAGKGIVLTQLSLWWFDVLAGVVPNHVISTDVPEEVAGRAVLCERLRMLPVECVVRGHLAGSGWLEYQERGSVCGVQLPSGLVNGDRLPGPIFTPATKADIGEHDENIDFPALETLVGEHLADHLRRTSLRIYQHAADVAAARGIILADTKFEFGQRDDGTVVLADEVLTPDSSRFWDGGRWVPGESLPSFDKQFVRDWLANDSGWSPTSDADPPTLPAGVVQATRQRYLEAFFRLTGSHLDLDQFAAPHR